MQDLRITRLFWWLSRRISDKKGTVTALGLCLDQAMLHLPVLADLIPVSPNGTNSGGMSCLCRFSAPQAVRVRAWMGAGGSG